LEHREFGCNMVHLLVVEEFNTLQVKALTGDDLHGTTLLVLEYNMV